MTIATDARMREVPPASETPRLKVDSLWITFGNNRVLRDVSLEVRPGEIHALVGQNGSGKSTLAKVLTGLYSPDAGTSVEVDGVPLRLPVRPSESRERGVAVVHQSLGLMDNLTVIENMRIGRLRPHGLLHRILWRDEREEAEAAFAQIGRQVPLDARVGDLREEDRATVAIARALQDARPGTGLIIFDESTRALGRRSLEQFFRILDGIVATGTAVLMITHRLEEVIDAADRVTVLRDGRSVEQGREVAGLTEAELTSMILGRNADDLNHHVPAIVDEAAEPVEISGVTGLAVEGVDLQLRRGEILGITGLAGSGYDDIPYLISGITPAAEGTLRLGDETLELSSLTPERAIAAGVAVIPEGREHSGLAMGMTVSENISFPQTASGASRKVDRAAERERAAEWIEQLDIRPPDTAATVGKLSGGNQQKVFVSKWMATDPKLLLLHEPTQAVDIGARHTIVSAVREYAAKGAYVLVAGSDENELALLCDRVLVFDQGAVREELATPFSPDDIVAAIYKNGSRGRLRERTDTAEVDAQ